jgi:putative metal-binding protein
MRFRSLVLVLVGVIAMPTFGADFVYTANTVSKPARLGAVVASGITWNCDANGCTTKGPWPVPGLGACRALAALVGPVKSYGHPGMQLSAAQLESCNGGPAKAMTATPLSQPIQAKPSTSTPRPATSGSVVAGPVAVGPTLRGAQLQQGIRLRAENYEALARARKRAEAEARRRADEAERRRIAANTHGGNDCDDSRRDVNPNAPEICDGLDNNCNGIVDERQTTRRYLDADGDGHGDPARGLEVCPGEISDYARSAETTGSPWLVEIGNDCDDRNPEVWRDCK